MGEGPDGPAAPLKEEIVKKAALVAVFAIAGLVAGPAAAQAKVIDGDCPDEPDSSQPFIAYGDDDSYFLAPSGDFEAAAPGWTLAGGAALVGSPAGTGTAVSLPPGATAISPPICVTRNHVSARLFGQAFQGPRRDRARISVDVAGPTGLVTADRNIRVEDSWQPTRQFRLGASFFDLDPVTGTTEIRMRFVTDGPATAVLDDLWVDPKARD
jgi:hypothetical protein